MSRREVKLILPAAFPSMTAIMATTMGPSAAGQQSQYSGFAVLLHHKWKLEKSGPIYTICCLCCAPPPPVSSRFGLPKASRANKGQWSLGPRSLGVSW